MGYSLKQWRQATTKLLELTSINEITWEISTIFQGDAWTLVDECYEAEYKGKTYTISKTRRKHYLDDVECVWELGYDLSIYTGNKYGGYSVIANCPSSIAIDTLFESAKGNLAINSDALGDLLDD
ncbi:hypothetical protein [Tritonibacter mobilis]|uniref:hypothetical protein n=1 Tax=Tritonibacter mobilis TaxID=379347 RepID=UPI000806886B|nr:hypothetical protein [Tritonibacter mobilis]GLP88261.1 hypothetical protein GCM10007921_38230 [Tritonibacter mobilis]SDY11632.1 hypothetical protein SAMN05444385_1335 [Tritonibacter mobilis]